MQIDLSHYRFVLGKAAVTSVLGMASNLECLLPFVEHAGKNTFNISYVCCLFVCLLVYFCVCWFGCLFVFTPFYLLVHAYLIC